jgi:hypothetical protein
MVVSETRNALKNESECDWYYRYLHKRPFVGCFCSGRAGLVYLAPPLTIVRPNAIGKTDKTSYALLNLLIDPSGPNP